MVSKQTMIVGLYSSEFSDFQSNFIVVTDVLCKAVPNGFDERCRMKFHITVVTAIIVMAVSANAFACGDSLYRVGKGVSYRTYTAPLPGNLLVFGTTEGARQLAEELARSGHGVQVVGSVKELSSALEKGGYDVVIAPFSARSTVEKMSLSSNASYLPIAMSDEEERLARQSYDRVMVPRKHELKHYLKEIHRVLRSNS